MARKTLDEEIEATENTISELEDKVAEHESFRSLQGQGSEGAATDFVDPSKLYQRIDQLNNRLTVLYARKDNTWVKILLI